MLPTWRKPILDRESAGTAQPPSSSGANRAGIAGRYEPAAIIKSMAENPTDAKPVESFEASLDELEKVVKQLEAGDLSLDLSLDLFERGVSLSDACRKQLEQAETRVEMLIRKEGKLTAEPFRPEKP